VLGLQAILRDRRELGGWLTGATATLRLAGDVLEILGYLGTCFSPLTSVLPVESPAVGSSPTSLNLRLVPVSPEAGVWLASLPVSPEAGVLLVPGKELSSTAGGLAGRGAGAGDGGRASGGRSIGPLSSPGWRVPC
jgi:hypothetical protein